MDDGWAESRPSLETFNLLLECGPYMGLEHDVSAKLRYRI